MSRVQQIAANFYCIDTHDLNREQRTSSYLLIDEKITLIETSASPSFPYIMEGLKELNIALEDIHYVIVTHIHLDHAGGAGLFLQNCPQANLVVHPRGSAHMILTVFLTRLCPLMQHELLKLVMNNNSI